MDEDADRPSLNADHAFPSYSTGAAAASWHPALRSNTDPSNDEEDDFFERYPGATPKKHEAVMLEEEQPSEPESPIRRQSISVLQESAVQKHDATAEELQRVPSHHAQAEGPASGGMYEEDDDEALIRDQEVPLLAADETVEEQEIALEQQMPDALPQETGGDDERPAEHYEHQGELTEMEEALDPDPETSLLANEEPLPTTDPIDREPTTSMPSRQSTIGFDGTPAPRQPSSKAPPAMPRLDRQFTTDLSDSPINPTPSQGRSIPDEWPSVGDDKTFGEILDHQQPARNERNALEATAAKEYAMTSAPDPDLDLLPEDEGEVKEEDLAAAWGAALDDDDMLEETPTDLDPSQFFGEDDDGFLEDEPTPLPAPVQPQHTQTAAPTTLQHRPASLRSVSHQPQVQPGMPSPQFFSQNVHGRAAGTPSTGLHDVYQHNQYPFTAPQQQQPQRPATLQQAQSFADKSKGGYQSPYDLPMEVVKPRRRAQHPAPPVQTQAPPVQAPPSTRPGAPQARKSSLASPLSPTGPPVQPQKPPSISSLSPPNSRGSTGSGGATSGVKPTPKGGGSSGFFEELPMTTKPRVRPGSAFTPQATPPMPTPPPQPVAMSPPRGPGPQQQQFYHPSAPQQQQAAMYGGLKQPDRMPLIPDQLLSQQQQPVQQQVPQPNPRYSPSPQQSNLPAPGPPPPPAQNRYSPAPTQHSISQPSRYSPAPAAQPAPAKPRQPSLPANAIQQANPFAPRTSSPLAAYTDKPFPPLPTDAPAPLISQGSYASQAQYAQQRGMPPPSSPPKINGAGMQRRSPPESAFTSKYSPVESRGIDSSGANFGPPLPRPRTQSPENAMKSALKMTRPTSAGMPPSTLMQPGPRPSGPVLPHRRQFSRELSFAAPHDERSLDPLQRWKGHPIFKWSASGQILSSFPKQTPFYSAGQGLPSVKCTPGAISIQDASQFMPMDERNAKFPGPLTARNKGRKKDVVAWMAGKIEDLERQMERAMMDFALPVEMKKRSEETVILWRVMRIFVENDGVLDGNAKIEEEVRRILLPNLAQMAQVAELQSPSSASVQRDAVDKSVTLQLRQALLEGDRERAVWLAEEKRLWGHAMLIASTMGPEVWKQIVQAFVRNQVKSFGSDARSIAALYQVFAGNSEESVDELVPPSARAGFQMISKSDGSVAGNPLEGLDYWRETLGLITSNRTPNDAHSLLALGNMLASYGRVEAAHTCYLFAKAYLKQSGPDDAEAHFVLLGANHQTADESFGDDLDSIILTEVYEYASSISAPSTAVPYIPHLQAFKLVHAQELAAYGLKTKAQAYCEAITSAYTSTTRPSPYYHPTFTQAVADMNAFLSQTPHDGKSGLFSRPAMKTVSSGAASWFTKFVAGDDDQESTGSGPGGAGSEGKGGPFGGVNGDSGSISRSASGTDLYNPAMGGMQFPGVSPPQAQPFAPSSAPSRYTPGNQTSAPRPVPTQMYSGFGTPSAEPQRPSSSRYAPPPSAGSNLALPVPELTRKSSNYSLNSRRGSGHDTSSQGSYEPRPILADEMSAYSYSPQVHSPPIHSPAVSSPLVLAQTAPAVHEHKDAFGGPNGISEPLNADDGGVDEEGGGGYLPPSSGYEPPSYSYQPYEPDPDSPEKPKRSTFGDDDDGGTEQRAAALKKSQADREADELFRKAAEADAARDKGSAAQKKGWFGWWGSGKDPNAMPGPIKAKLGEENSFYYDENLKKWVNKKGGAEAPTSAAPTPPPPRGQASRVASATMGPPSGPPSRASSGSGLVNMARPPTSGSGTAISGPPSRSGSPASNPPSEVNAPTSINGEPLAPPTAPFARPQSSLSNASSIDDLLGGPPGPRKAGAGGTLKGKKKGGRYVDVMAK